MNGTRRAALLGGFLCFLGAAITWILVLKVQAAAELDDRALAGFEALSESMGRTLNVAELLNERSFVLMCTGLFLIALLRGKVRLAVIVAFVLIGSNYTTQFLQHVLTDPRATGSFDRIGAWPSGHTTAVMSLALVLILVSPRKLRPIIGAISGLAAIGYVYVILIRGNHLPSDIIGGFLVASGFTFFGIALLDMWEGLASARENGNGKELGRAIRVALIAVIGLTVCGLTLLVIRYDALTFIADYTSFAAGAVAIAALGMALSLTLVAIYRRS